MDLGKAIAEVRVKKGWTQKQAGDKIGYTPQQLSIIENKRDFSSKVLQKICKAYDALPVAVVFMATDINDVPEDKKDFYLKLKPHLQAIIDSEVLKVGE